VSDNQEYKQFYSEEADVYEKTRYRTGYGSLFRQLHYEVLAAACRGIAKEARVLEVACGTGHTTRLMNSMGMSFTACDLTPNMMLQARNSIDADKSDVQFVQASAYRLPFADNSFDFLISTRFLHLFGSADQNALCREFRRVLKPGGKILIDLDNLVARWVYVIPHLFYNLIFYRRLAPDSNYNSPGQARRLMTDNGFVSPELFGIGGWHLYLVKLFSPRLAYRFGLRHRYAPFRILAEQFVVLASAAPDKGTQAV